MAFELPDGKTARTLPEQVKFLTEKLKELYAAFNALGIKKVEIVESLPEVGQEGILYMVPVEDPDAKNYYEEYIWLDSQWEMIGTTKIDLSGYVTTDTEQTITAAKTIKEELKFADKTNTNSVVNSIKTDQYGGMAFSRAGLTAFAVGGTDVRFANRHLLPNVNNTTYSLGAENSKWKDAYLSNSIYLGNCRVGLDNNRLALYDSNGDLRFIFANTSQACCDLIPYSNNNLNLGSAQNYWKDLYISGKIYLAATTYISANSSGYISVEVNNTTIASFTDTKMYLRRDLRAFNDGSQNIGSTTERFGTGYFKNGISDGTNSATVADIAALITYAKAQGWIS